MCSLMCLLVFLFGSNSHPLLLCSNRDETFARKTLQGQYYHQHEAYYPVDELAGGTWIALSAKEDGRFAVILNFDIFRYESLDSYTTPPNPKSRGLIPHLFLNSSSDVTPVRFGEELLANNDYQGYNLILGDKHSCCYVSNFDHTIQRLLPSTLYGISNGRMIDEWPKVSISKERIRNHLNETFILTLESARLLADQLFEVMKDSTLLPDALYGTSIAEYMNLSAICVPPFRLNENPYGTRTTTVVIALPNTQDPPNLLVVEYTRLDPDQPMSWHKSETIMNYASFSSQNAFS